MRDVRVGVQRDVRDRVPLADEEPPAREVPLHDVERLIAALDLLRIDGFAEEVRPEAGDGDVRLVAVLLEEHPLEHLGAREAVVGEERRPVGEVEEDGAGLGQPAAVLELEHGDAAVRIDREEFRRAGLALEDVLLDQPERAAELRQQQPDLVAVSRRQVVVQRQHVRRLARVDAVRNRVLPS